MLAPTLPVGDGLSVARLGFGTWAWGNKLLWGYDESADGVLQTSFDTPFGVDESSFFFDTGDSYGTGEVEGQAERLLGQF